MNRAVIQPAVQGNLEETQGRRPLAHLLHALNQPLTGLQCSMELAIASPRRPDQYVQTLREGLELAARMRCLVEALRELAELEQGKRLRVDLVRLDELFAEISEELRPVAEAKRARIEMQVQKTNQAADGSYAVRADRRQLTALAFHLIESALSLAHAGSTLRLSCASQAGEAQVAISWVPGAAPAHSPFSPPELGLIVAQAGWEQAGARWMESQNGQMRNCNLRMFLADVTALGEAVSSETATERSR
jgi:signal transduction histidine kinase